MLTRAPRRYALLLLLSCAAAALLGCSLIGLGLGAAADSRAKDVEVPGWRIEEVRKGSKIELELADGSRVSGKFEGLAREGAEAYAARWAQAQQRLLPEHRLPALGEGASVFSGSGGQAQAELLGVDLGGLAFRQRGRQDSQLFSLASLARVEDAEGRALEGTTLQGLVRSGRVPLLSQVMVLDEAQGRRRSVSVDSITQVRAPARKNAKLTGFLAGLAIDVVVLIVAVSSLGDTRQVSHCGPNDPYCASCPYVYSYDGEQYRLDSEIFGGAIFEAAQRTAWDRLDQLREVAGEYRIKVTNELRETQHLDELKLLAVDHPRGARVIPSLSGELRVLSRPRAPELASDAAGRDVLPLLAETDGRVWLGNPFTRDPSDPNQVRDAVTLEFPGDSRRQEAKLALRVQNTVWASYLRRHTLELFGRDLDRWYARLNASAEARARLEAASLREAMLRVEAWDGAAWRAKGFVWEVGPAVAKWQVVPLDLSDVSGETLRIRLSSTVGHWLVDAALLDDTPDPTLLRRRLAPSSARDQDGTDALPALARQDGRRHVMPTTRDWVELRFAAPPLGPGLERTLLLESSGYYTIHVSAEGEPQTALIERLLNEPGAYGRYTVELLNAHRDRALARLALR